MSTLFDSVRVGSMELPNRFVRSATWEGMAGEDGSSSSKLNAMMGHLAKNEIGLIITGHAYVSPEGQAGPWQLGIHTDEMIPGLTEMTAKAHQAGGKICCQLAHAGNRGAQDLTNLQPFGPSDKDFRGKARDCKAMTADDIQAVIQAFGNAASRAKQAGFDAVQIHSAHGYLLGQFLSPFYNLRDDQYGGNRENRERLTMDVYTAVREAVGPDYPVLIKLNAHDYMHDLENSYTLDDMLSICARLNEAGIDAIELSGGTIDSRQNIPSRMGMIKRDREGFHRKAAEAYKKTNNGAPLMLVGGIRSFEKAEQFVNDGICDFISLCRPLIREPNLIKRWKSGDHAKAECMSDNLCFKPVRAGEGLYCLLKKKQLENKKEK
ncbi:NADH:flavin oxidoreductase [Desulfovibrio ferrophilus]|uniref:Putative NADH:flavin oxidoreductase n=1 Tax=Desulfovibrio ferrophilus TaxID=241368 RepID=A0A2Z6B0E2_9BACT|nr:NADH:flavin oxidoreductase [Desulfovibrio ferrophilus]BBD08997.1 putative NADH:flavin oxidoreductase [Desulfovibrio ferrophilus]